MIRTSYLFNSLEVDLALYAARIEREAAMYGQAPETYLASIAEEEARQVVKQTPDVTAFAIYNTVQPGLFVEALTAERYRSGQAVLRRARLVSARQRRDLDEPDSPALKTPDGWTALKRLS